MFLFALALNLAHAQLPARDFARERDELDAQVEGSRRRAAFEHRSAMMMSGLGKVAARERSALDYARSKCNVSYRPERQVDQLCDARGCLPIFGDAKQTAWFGYFHGCDLVLANGTPCEASTGTIDGRDVVAITCTRPSLDRVEYEVSQANGSLRQTGFSKRPRAELSR